MEIAKPYTITNPAAQAEDIDRMFDELYRALQQMATGATGAAASSGSGITIAQVSTRVLHEL